MEVKKSIKSKEREAGMMTIAGLQGVGKTYGNMHMIKEYVKDKFHNGVKGRKFLIFDTNGEYTQEQFEENDIPGFPVRKIAMKDIAEWGRSSIVECRRIDAKNLSIKEKKECVEYIIKVLRNSGLAVDDINNFILSVTHMEEIVGGLINLRHRAVDVLISYQSLRPVEPRIFQNSRWIKLFRQTDHMNDIRGKIPNIALFRIAQIIVDTRYFAGDKRFHVYIHNFLNKIEGDFTKKEFLDACDKYVNANKKYIKDYKEMHNVTMEEATLGLIKQYYRELYGNDLQ
jgi:hypothetical protein